MIRATPTRVQYYYMRQSLLGFAMIRRWALLADVFEATPENTAKWKKAKRENNKLVKALRDAALSQEEPLEPEASKALRKLMKGYASSL